MRIFHFDAADDRWQTLRFVSGDPPAFAPWNSIHNKPLADEWIPPMMKPRDINLPLADFPMFLGRVLIVGTRAQAVLTDVLATSCEFLPINCNSPAYVGANVLRQVDALNKKDSRIQWISKAKGLASKIHKFAFKSDMLSHELLFRIPELPFDLFATEQFAEILYARDLKGFSVNQVWTDD